MFHRAIRISAIGATMALAISASMALAQSTEVRLGMVLEPPHLDPTAGAAAAIDGIVYANVFEGLTRIDETGAVLPSLAIDWTISDDDLIYTFTLKPDVTFHDGTTFNADDVVFSFERAMAEDSVNAQKGIFEPIEEVRAVDDLTAVIMLKRPIGDFLFNIGRGDAVIVAPESADSNQTKPVGTGPFKLAQWNKGSRIILEAWNDYTGDPVFLSKVTFVFMSDPNTAISAMLAGDLDGFPFFPAPETLDVFASDDRFKVLVGTTEGETILATNNKKAPFDDLRVRQAIAHAIDRKALIDGAMFGYGSPIGSHFAPHHPYFIDETGTYPFDIAAAKKLLAAAGYADGFDATLKLPPPSYARRGGQILAAQLREIGIRLELINVEWAQWLEDVFTNKDYDLTIVSHVEPFDIGIYANPDYYFQFDNEDFQALMTRLGTTTDESARMALAAYAQNFLARHAVNGFLFQLALTGVWNAKLEGMWLNSPVEGTDLTQVHWVE